MELWTQLREAGLEPPGLGPPPRALRMPPPEDSPGHTLMAPGTDTRGARETLLGIWKELRNLRRVDVQLLGQLCHLGLEIGALREELLTILEEEEEGGGEEEDEEPQRLQEEGLPGASYPTLGLPDFEMTI
uniref:Glutamate rich 4 n=1 Tax=Jaculus jaculus TaxID=51337 RepID=A0A8C5KRM8_JACJA|nr:glutamate-rich protein 4 [Jaculus jaculus]